MGFDFGNKTTSGKKAGFMASASRIPDPLADVEYTGNVEKDSAAELDAVAEGWRERGAREADRFKNATDSEYWFAMCFKTREDKDAFLKATGLDKIGDKYLDGHMAARLLKIDMAD